MPEGQVQGEDVGDQTQDTAGDAHPGLLLSILLCPTGKPNWKQEGKGAYDVIPE